MKNSFITICVFSLFISMFVSVSCSNADSSDNSSLSGETTGADSKPGSGSYSDADMGASSTDSTAGGDSKPADTYSDSAPSSDEEYTSIDEDAGTGSEEESATAGTLTAGEWNDLNNWDFWKDIQKESEWAAMSEYWGYNTLGRYSVQVLSESEKPIIDAAVSLIDENKKIIWKARTNNNGFANLFNDMFEIQETLSQISVEYNDVTKVVDTPQSFENGINKVVLPTEPDTQNILDLMFVFDTTGSMGDELEYIKVEMADVIQQIKENQQQNVKIRLSCNYYRDIDDEYVVKSNPFNENIAEIISDLKNQQADGGGDTEEAVHTALNDAVENHEWSKNAKARILFLVLDASPHNNQEGVVESLHKTTIAAAEKGIRIIPVASSGVLKDTEFFLRYIDIATDGTYIFLTDDSGVGTVESGGDGHIKPTIGDYEVMPLNKILIKVVTDLLSSPNRS